MIKRKLTEADWFLILINLLAVYGVWFGNWNVKEVFLVYGIETIIIGFFTLTKLGIATAVRKKDWLKNNGSKTMRSGLFLILFFLLHYSLFVVVQTTLLFAVISMHDNSGPSNIFQFILRPNKYLGSEGWLLLYAFVFGYGYENLMRFFLNNDYRTKSFTRITFEPYMRILIQQVTVLIGSFALTFSADKIFIFVFAAIKIFITVFIDYENALSKPGKKKSIYQESNNSHS